MTLTDTQPARSLPQAASFRDTSNPANARGADAVGVTFLSRAHDLDALEPAWCELARDACDPNPFYEAHMLRPALDHLKGGRSAQVMAVFDDIDPARLIGLMPVRIHATYRGLPVKVAEPWKHIHDFLATPLLRKGYGEKALRAMIAALKARGVTICRFHLGSAEGEFAHALDAVASKENLPACETRTFERAILQSSLPGEEYLAQSIPKKKRKEFGRLSRRLADAGKLVFETADMSDAAAVEGVVLEFLELERSGWKGRAGTAMAQRPHEARFFLNACRGAAARGQLLPLTLRLDGVPVASIINFAGGGADANGLFSFKIAYDENYARTSPGVLLELELTARILADTSIAFTDSCANPDHPMIDHLWRERRAMRDINLGTHAGVPALLIHTTGVIEHALAALKKQAAHIRAWLRRRTS